jgi:hypothetical protein
VAIIAVGFLLPGMAVAQDARVISLDTAFRRAIEFSSTLEPLLVLPGLYRLLSSSGKNSAAIT